MFHLLLHLLGVRLHHRRERVDATAPWELVCEGCGRRVPMVARTARERRRLKRFRVKPSATAKREGTGAVVPIRRAE